MGVFLINDKLKFIGLKRPWGLPQTPENFLKKLENFGKYAISLHFL